MIINLFNQTVMISIVFGAVYLLANLLIFKPFHFLYTKWHYYFRASLYVFLLLPCYEVLSHILFEIKGRRLFMFAEAMKPVELANDDTISFWLNSNPILSLPFLSYVWMAGAVMFITLCFIERYKFKRYIFRTCSLINDKEIWNVFQDCKIHKGVETKVMLYSSPYLTSPFIYGMYRPIIVLPEK